MLRITVSKNAKAASKYFDEGLSKQDYYSEKNEIVGKWHGKLAHEFGLSGEVSKEDFEKLASNINPSTNEQLNVRDSDSRRAGYDFTFSAPKSVSLIYSLTGDKEILSAFEASVQKSMMEVEKDMQTQKGQGKNKEYQTTSNIAYAAFTHFNARPVDGIPDPHLHQHCYVFNTTKNEEKDRYQAIEVGTVKGNAPYYEALFHSELATNLQKIGYAIERDEHNFQIKGFDKETIDKFSNRTREIEDKAQELGISYSEDKGALGAKTRADKSKGLSNDVLEKRWQERLTEAEKEKVFSAKNNDNNDDKKEITASQTLDYALSHALERQSTISEKRMLGEALKRGIGQVSADEIKKEYDQRSDILSKTDKRTKDKDITTRQALEEEKKLIHSVRAGRGNYEAINTSYEIQNKQLSDEQSHAVNHALRSKNFITIITGGAGTGKTWSIKEVAQGVEASGKSFHAFAPSADASRGVQREEGFNDATTIASLLQDEKLQSKIKDGVMWIDESGMVGNKTMNQLIDVAKTQNARILLTGDTKQHNSVERGDAMRIIQDYGGTMPAFITKIHRQKTDEYKNAVKWLSEGKVEKGYDKLEQMGAIKEVVDMNSLKQQVATEYADAAGKKENVMVVATTHAQGAEATKAIRHKLKEQGTIEQQDHTYTVHKDKSYTDAQKQDSANFQKGMSIQFHQNAAGGFKRGNTYDIIGQDKKGNVLVSIAGADEKKKESMVLPLDHSQRFSVYEKQKIGLAIGDKIRITKNGSSNENKRLNNGDLMTIHGFDKGGNVLAFKGKSSKNLMTLDKDYRNLTHGYYTTSPASQGKSVDKVIVMQSSASGKASSKEQFYVSASRGKFSISVYTDDKQYLLRSVKQSTTRTTAMDIAAQSPSLKDKHKRKEHIFKVAVSKSKEMWHKSKEYIGNVNQKIMSNVKQVSGPAPARK